MRNPKVDHKLFSITLDLPKEMFDKLEKERRRKLKKRTEWIRDLIILELEKT